MSPRVLTRSFAPVRESDRGFFLILTSFSSIDTRVCQPLVNMPFVLPSNNRVLPANARAADVAKTTLPRVIQAQRLRNHAAFVANAYPVVIYHRLNSGQLCHCQNRADATRTRLALDAQGNASSGMLNELLTGGTEFGVRDYGRVPGTLFHIDSSLYEDVGGRQRTAAVGTGFDALGSSDRDVTSIVTEGRGVRGPFSQDVDGEALRISSDLFGTTDVTCPVCFGSGYVGGFSVLNGVRIVLNHQHSGLSLPATSVVHVEDRVPRIRGAYADFTLAFPVGARFVDAFRVWNGRTLASASLQVDGVPLSSADAVLRYFDGRTHTLRVTCPEFTHVELQIGVNDTTEYVDFPKVQRSSLAELLDSMDDVQLVLSPLVPLIRPNDVIADGVHNKVFHVRSSTGAHDRRLSVLGWECDARVVQAQELMSLLPRRRVAPVASPNSPARLLDNGSGHRRT